MKLIVVTGLIGSGKGEVARYIAEKHGYTLLDHSAIMGKMLRGMGRSETREEKAKLRLEQGNTFTAEIIVKEIQKRGLKKVVIGSSRRPEEFLAARKAFPEAKLVVVEASGRLRYARLQKRVRDRPKDWESFLRVDKKEEKMFSLKETFSHADFVIKNNSSLKDLHAMIDKVMGKI
ncbi:MAG: AAA family ATPase [Candidatus Aenigmarchaeota archaeon]|nr:AAA family ATPase [Candidatus Aenigmarchaeota archaeon]